MPHIIVKMCPGRTGEKKRELADRLAAESARTLGVDEGELSVDIREVPEEDWAREVYRADILGRMEQLYRRPDYTYTAEEME